MQPLGSADREAVLEGPTLRAHGGMFRHEVESPYISFPDACARGQERDRVAGYLEPHSSAL